ncbi:HAD family phosphatase [Streptomyces sp. 549]|uniref:HAD family hydrolase n=1 Tax=Streptomyces sp. 549 TaxID=3049076 RepID=UPI0024C41366|nr:HAD family phosphatase [Streptomyces sp. 549]MDK1474686.1 HAD family phosphatase [Streptomyces sp. 549]
MSTGTPRRAVIFDLDGTLVDSEPHYYRAGREVLARHGVPGFTWEEHTRFIGVGTRETLEELRRTHHLAAPVEQLLDEKNAAYLALARRSMPVFPRMADFVRLLHEAGHPLIVASGSSRTAIEAVLTGTGLASRLPRWVSAEEVARGKPEPDVFLEAARRMGADPAACVVVEDAPAGVRAAAAAGMACIAVPYAGGAADDPAFAAAQLCFPDGQEGFDASAAYAWVRDRA